MDRRGSHDAPRTKVDRRIVSALVAGVVVGALLITPAGAHISTSAAHNWNTHYLPLAMKSFFTKGQADARFAPTSHAHNDAYFTKSQADKRFAKAGGDLTAYCDTLAVPSSYAPCVVAHRVAVDTAGSVGFHTSIAIGTDGNPVISYYDSINADLRVAKCGDPICSTANTLTTVDASANVGQYSSIAIGTDGNPVISYKYSDSATSTVKVARCGNPACSAGNTFNVLDVMGEHTSIAIGADGNPVVSYYDIFSTALGVARCGDPACSLGNTLYTVDDSGSVGEYSSIAIGTDGNPVIAYYDVGNRDLKVARCADSACLNLTSVPTAVDAIGDVGRYSAIAIGADGNPVISYHDWFNGELRVAKCGNPACSSGNTLTPVDTSGNMGRYSSIAIGADGNPVVSYLDFINKDLKVARCGNPACSLGNTLTTVDAAGHVGEDTSIAIGTDGNPVVAYRDILNADLKVARPQAR